MRLTFNNDNEFIEQLTEIVIANLGNEKFGVDELVHASGLSHAAVLHKIKSTSQKTISQFINEIRLQKALEILQNEQVTSSEVAYKVGFGSPAYFNSCFHEFYGCTPGEVKKKIAQTDIAPVQEEVEMPDKINGAIKTVLKRPLIIRISQIIITLLIIWLAYMAFFSNTKNGFNGKNERNKSIAVLPFINDSPDTANVYLINGIMDAILENLSAIKDLRVVSRNSVEQYRNNKTKTIKEIARELGVNYLVEGSGQKYGDQIKLTVQLIDANTDKHLLSQNYVRNLEDIFSIESEVALQVASRIKAVVTHEEKELIEASPTNNLAALYMFERGHQLYDAASILNSANLRSQAVIYFRKAVELDSTYTNPIVSIGWILKYFGKGDSAMFMANKALKINPKCAEAHYLKGNLLHYIFRQEKEAEVAYNNALKYRPNYVSPMYSLGNIYLSRGDFAKAIEFQIKALNNDVSSPGWGAAVGTFCHSLYLLGFFGEGMKYAEKQIHYFNDSLRYYEAVIGRYVIEGELISARKNIYKIINLDRNLGYTPERVYLFLRDYKGALDYIQKKNEHFKQSGRRISPDSYQGYIYLMNGKTAEAEFHLKGSIDEWFTTLEEHQHYSSCRACLNLARIYSGMGDKSKAMEYFRKVLNCSDWTISHFQIYELKHLPMYDAIRDEPEFQKFISDMEARFEVERRKVEEVLREEGVLVSKD